MSKRPKNVFTFNFDVSKPSFKSSSLLPQYCLPFNSFCQAQSKLQLSWTELALLSLYYRQQPTTLNSYFSAKLHQSLIKLESLPHIANPI